MWNLLTPSEGQGTLTMKIALTITEAAEAVGVSDTVIRAAIKRGDIPVRYPTSRPVIDVDDLSAWVKSLPTERRQ